METFVIFVKLELE